MNRRVRKIANFFAFNLLFFALYLNFIHKDPNPAFGGNTVSNSPAAAFSESTTADKEIAQKKTESATKENADTKLAVN